MYALTMSLSDRDRWRGIQLINELLCVRPHTSETCTVRVAARPSVQCLPLRKE